MLHNGSVLHFEYPKWIVEVQNYENNIDKAFISLYNQNNERQASLLLKSEHQICLMIKNEEKWVTSFLSVMKKHISLSSLSGEKNANGARKIQ